MCLASAVILASLLLPAIKSHAEQPDFTFGIITDVHYCDCDPVNQRYYRKSLGKLEKARDEIKKLKKGESLRQ